MAYFIPEVGAQVTVSEFREFLQQKLPAYMIPSFFVEMEAFPLTPNGKIDRRLFPEPETSKLESDAGYVAPQGELEAQLAGIWRKALNVERIGANDNFFELGGHSLLAAQLFAQIERKLGVNLPLAILFQAPSIRQLSEKIKQNTAWPRNWERISRFTGCNPEVWTVTSRWKPRLKAWPRNTWKRLSWRDLKGPII